MRIQHSVRLTRVCVCVCVFVCERVTWEIDCVCVCVCAPNYEIKAFIVIDYCYSAEAIAQIFLFTCFALISI